jgi:methionine aminopeptidase
VVSSPDYCKETGPGSPLSCNILTANRYTSAVSGLLRLFFQYRLRYLKDGWTVVTADKKLSAQYEHTITVTSNGCEILTPWHLLMRHTAELA